MRPRFSNNTDYVTGIDLDLYLNYVASVTPLKTPPAFDQYGVLLDTPTPENSVFGDEEGTPANFTDFSLRHRLRDNDATLGEDMARRVFVMNPMNFISEELRQWLRTGLYVMAQKTVIHHSCTGQSCH